VANYQGVVVVPRLNARKKRNGLPGGAAASGDGGRKEPLVSQFNRKKKRKSCTKPDKMTLNIFKHPVVPLTERNTNRKEGGDPISGDENEG